jgi:acyl-CoA reductase-like NAD-dependent aldehyde dehydrogenase
VTLTIEHWINGAATPAGSTRTAPVYHPATGREQARVLLAEPADVDTAVAAAAKAFEAWGDSSLSQRTKVMFAFRELLVQHEDELARIISRQHGKVDDARGEIVRGREVVEYACGIADALKGSFSDQVSRDEAIAVVNANPYGNGTAIFTGSGEAARKFQREVKVGMIGVNVPIPVPMSYYSFGGWKDSLIGDSPIHGPEGVRFYTRAKVVTTRWPHTEAAFNFPTST